MDEYKSKTSSPTLFCLSKHYKDNLLFKNTTDP